MRSNSLTRGTCGGHWGGGKNRIKKMKKEGGPYVRNSASELKVAEKQRSIDRNRKKNKRGIYRSGNYNRPCYRGRASKGENQA